MQQNAQISLDDMISKILTEKRITQVELAKQLNISSPQVSRWRQGDNKPRRRVMAKIQKIYDEL